MDRDRRRSRRANVIESSRGMIECSIVEYSEVEPSVDRAMVECNGVK